MWADRQRSALRFKEPPSLDVLITDILDESRYDSDTKMENSSFYSNKRSTSKSTSNPSTLKKNDYKFDKKRNKENKGSNTSKSSIKSTPSRNTYSPKNAFKSKDRPYPKNKKKKQQSRISHDSTSESEDN